MNVVCIYVIALLNTAVLHWVDGRCRFSIDKDVIDAIIKKAACVTKHSKARQIPHKGKYNWATQNPVIFYKT